MTRISRVGADNESTILSTKYCTLRSHDAGADNSLVSDLSRHEAAHHRVGTRRIQDRDDGLVQKMDWLELLMARHSRAQDSEEEASFHPGQRAILHAQHPIRLRAYADDLFLPFGQALPTN